ncbi:MAG: hypothetical protein ACQEQU_03445 [Spirochaetota bacterium]
MSETNTITWLRLDNAGKLYPSIEGRQRPSIFHVSAVLRETVDSTLLQKAVAQTSPRFPFFTVQLRQGLFWYYFDRSESVPTAQQEGAYPCSRLTRKTDNRHMFRVIYGEKRIGVEFFHALTDGTGALAYLKTLLTAYLRLVGHHIPPSPDIAEPNTEPDPQEEVDAFGTHYRKQKKRAEPKQRAFHTSGQLETPGTLHVITAEMPIQSLKEVAKRYGTTITEYLAAVHLFSLYRIQERMSLRKQPIRLSVPVNLRNYFPSASLRNFSLFLRPEINPALGSYTFAEVVKHVHHSIQYELQTKHLSAAVSANVALERHLAVKLLPIWLKKAIMSFVYHHFGENLHSGTLSNLGLVTLPEEIGSHIDAFDFILGQNRINPENCAVIGYGDKLRINFSRITVQPAVTREFFSLLAEQGVHVSLVRDF